MSVAPTPAAKPGGGSEPLPDGGSDGMQRPRADANGGEPWPPADRSDGARCPPLRRVEPYLLRGLDFVHRAQLPTGEIPSCCRVDGEILYCLSPLASTLAHDALAVFDPASPRCERGGLALLAPAAARRAVALAAAVRRRIRGFVAWQELADGRFAFFGRGGGLAPDASTTACAAAVLLEAAERAGGPAPDPPALRHLAALARHRAACGRYYTYVTRDGRGDRGYAGLDPHGVPVGTFDRVVNAHVLRYLALAGRTEPELAEWLGHEAAAGGLAAGSPDHPEPLVFLHAVARAFGQARLPGHETLGAALVPRVFARWQPGTGLGGPLANALAVHALLDLGSEEPRLLAVGRALLTQAGGGGAWAGEPYVLQGAGSPSLSTALAVSALLRLAALGGAELAA